MQKKTLWLTGILGVALTMAAHAATLVNGAGATFPYPIYSKWFDEFHKLNPDLQINYQSIGSGGGIRQVTDGTVDFGATDGPMTDEQLAAAKTPILHFPTVLGAVVPTFNLQGIETLKFSPDVLAAIFLGKIKEWNDPAIAKDNPGVKLPDEAIVPIHRSDGSGTTYVFTDYLNKVSADWTKGPGKGTAVSWPVGLGGKGNEGVAGLVKQTPNAIGYVELIYALQNKLSYGDVRNKSGVFVRASLESVTAAAAAATSNMPADFRVSITDAEAMAAYPIASFTWLLIPSQIADSAKGQGIKKFLSWMVTDGQKFAKDLGYAPLPSEVVALEQKAFPQVKVGGQ